MVAKNVKHGNFYVTEYEIDITDAMREQAWDFAKKIIISDNQYSRLAPKDKYNRPVDEKRKTEAEIQRTYAGKLGELAFYTLLKEKGKKCDIGDMFEIYEGQTNTDSYDFITANGSTVDIKSGFRENHKRLMVNRGQLEGHNPKDYYVGVKLIARDVPGDDKLIDKDSVTKAVIKGYISRASLERTQYKNFGEGSAKHCFYNELNGIDELLKQF